MDIPKIITETTPNSEATSGSGVESTPVAEVVSAFPVPAQVAPVADDTFAADIIVKEPDSVETVAAVEIEDLTSSTVESADNNWVGRVRDVIKDDEGNPFKEEADAETLNEEYMKTRFNVDVDAPIEEK